MALSRIANPQSLLAADGLADVLADIKVSPFKSALYQQYRRQMAYECHARRYQTNLIGQVVAPVRWSGEYLTHDRTSVSNDIGTWDQTA